MPKLETTEQRPSSILIAQANTSASITPEIERQIQSLFKMQSAAFTLGLLSRCSDATGGYVQFKPEHQFFPVLIGHGDAVTPLYEFAEVLDEVLDYDLILNELPTLSYSHIGGALAFLRKLALTNPQNIDLDEIEDMALASNSELLQQLRDAFADKESARVLNRG
jgi:hypothetical protein